MVYENEKPGTKRVQSALKTAIEINLARERALARVDLGGVAFHSNGVIFSKSGDGTPFSNGIIFSKTGRVEIQAGDPAVHEGLVQQLSELDEAAFSAFTTRLLTLKQAKGQRGPAQG
jgi:hypothetical protein